MVKDTRNTLLTLLLVCFYPFGVVDMLKGILRFLSCLLAMTWLMGQNNRDLKKVGLDKYEKP